MGTPSGPWPWMPVQTYNKKVRHTEPSLSAGSADCFSFLVSLVRTHSFGQCSSSMHQRLAVSREHSEMYRKMCWSLWDTARTLISAPTMSLPSSSACFGHCRTLRNICAILSLPLHAHEASSWGLVIASVSSLTWASHLRQQCRSFAPETVLPS